MELLLLLLIYHLLLKHIFFELLMIIECWRPCRDVLSLVDIPSTSSLALLIFLRLSGWFTTDRSVNLNVGPSGCLLWEAGAALFRLIAIRNRLEEWKRPLDILREEADWRVVWTHLVLIGCFFNVTGACYILKNFLQVVVVANDRLHPI